MRSTILSAAALFVLLVYILAYGNGAETAQDNPEYHTEKMNLSLPAQTNSVSLDLRALAELIQKSLDSRGAKFLRRVNKTENAKTSGRKTRSLRASDENDDAVSSSPVEDIRNARGAKIIRARRHETDEGAMKPMEPMELRIDGHLRLIPQF